MSKGKLKNIGLWLFIVVALVVGLWRIAHFVKASVGYNVAAEFAVMPADDKGLQSWLEGQRGVVRGTVHVVREGSKVEVSFIMSQDVSNDPPFPDLERTPDQLGYAGRKGPWQDVPR